jgi:hypothetical protein
MMRQDMNELSSAFYLELELAQQFTHLAELLTAFAK